MANPTNVSITGTRLIQAGAAPKPTYYPTVKALEDAPAGKWVKVNANTFQEAWPPVDFRTTFTGLGGDGPGQSTSNPNLVVLAWAGFAWDDDNCRMFIFGGGHANTNTTESYLWEASTRKWKLAFYAHEIHLKAQVPANGLFTECTKYEWGNDAPTSMHTYSNWNWLKKQRRAYVGSGATHPSGYPPQVFDKNDPSILHRAGAYTVDLSKAGTGCVGTATGTNVKRTGTSSAGVNLVGANAWSLRNWYKDHPKKTTDIDSLDNGRTAYAVVENGEDVLYCTSSTYIVRRVMHPTDYKQDQFSWVGDWNNGGSTDTPMVVDQSRNLLMVCPIHGNKLGYYNLATANLGKSNPYVTVPTSAVTGPGGAEFLAASSSNGITAGVLFDERRKCLVVYLRNSGLYEIHLPKTAPFNVNWYVKKVYSVGSQPEFAMTSAVTEAAICGRFKRSEKLDAYIFLSDNEAEPSIGDVWFFKPHGWRNPLI